jgi:hypothetical protein
MSRHSGLIALSVCLVASGGCPDGDGISKNPLTPTTPLVTVELGGRLVNADDGSLLANVKVSVGAWAAPGTFNGPFPTQKTTTSGAAGTFTLSVSVPSAWTFIGLSFTGLAGYDDADQRFEPSATPCRFTPCWAAADRPTMGMYPTLTIRPGESIDVRVYPGVTMCAFAAAFDCRRVVVEASPAGPVELEIVTLVSNNPSNPMGLVESIWDEDPLPRRTIIGTEAYVYNVGTARVTARR